MPDKHILMIGTGGTIASEATGDGLAPELSAEQLLRSVPAISSLCEVTCQQPFSIDSTDMTPAHWLTVAARIRENYAQYDGFVISHGTDTMAYTAAALSYLIQGGDKPIVLTGAQKPIGFDTTDSKVNLEDAFRCASSGHLPGVQIVFNGRVIAGTRAQKTRSKSFQAFSSINYPELAVIQDGVLIPYIQREPSAPVFYDRLNTSVGLLKMYPGIDREVIRYLLNSHEALIIESFGVGGLPSYEDSPFAELVWKEGVEKGKLIIMTTQVQKEGSDIAVYHVGHRLKGWERVLEAYDMTTESALAKTMWILGQTREWNQVRNLFYTPVAWDILYQERRDESWKEPSPPSC